MTLPPDPFADPIPRDQWKRPLIVPMQRGKPALKAKPIGYTRASSFAEALVDGSALTKWRLWLLALGLGHNPDLATLAGTYPADVDALTPQQKRDLGDLIERAHDRAGGNAKADHGTAVHALTEPGSTGRTPEHLTADVAAFSAALTQHGLEIVDTERFVVCDDVQAAGTFDHTVRATRDLTFERKGAEPVVIWADTVLILDKKTGKLHFDSQCVQLALYAHAEGYDPETGAREPLGVDRDWGVIAHLPAGAGRCDLHLVDLRAGWAAAQLAGKVRKHRARKDLALPFPAVDPEPVVAAEPADLGRVLCDCLEEIVEPVELEPVVAAEPAVERTAELVSGWIDERHASGEVAACGRRRVRVPAAVVEITPSPPLDAAGVQDALHNLRALLGAEEFEADRIAEATASAISAGLRAARTRDDLEAVWREHRDAWVDAIHTPLLRACAARIGDTP